MSTEKIIVLVFVVVVMFVIIGYGVWLMYKESNYYLTKHYKCVVCKLPSQGQTSFRNSVVIGIDVPLCKKHLDKYLSQKTKQFNTEFNKLKQNLKGGKKWTD